MLFSRPEQFVKLFVNNFLLQFIIFSYDYIASQEKLIVKKLHRKDVTSGTRNYNVYHSE